MVFSSRAMLICSSKMACYLFGKTLESERAKTKVPFDTSDMDTGQPGEIQGWSLHGGHKNKRSPCCARSSVPSFPPSSSFIPSSSSASRLPDSMNSTLRSSLVMIAHAWAALSVCTQSASICGVCNLGEAIIKQLCC